MSNDEHDRSRLFLGLLVLGMVTIMVSYVAILTFLRDIGRARGYL